MINNRQAGRRRGRNNPRQQGGGNRGNGDSGNRIDNRARGNAAQLLEKYRNMARDAQMAGDRVNMEYYLQFADHYFRVLADNRARQEENQQRFQRNDEPVDGYDNGDDGFGSMDDGDEGNPGEHEFPPQSQNRDREQQGRRYEGRNDGRGDNRNESRNEGRGDDSRDRNRNDDNRSRNRDNGARPERDNRDNAARPERDDRNRNNGRRPRVANDDRDESEEIGLPLAALPPAIGRIEEEPAAEPEAGNSDAPKPRRGRRPRQAEAAE